MTDKPEANLSELVTNIQRQLIERRNKIQRGNLSPNVTCAGGIIYDQKNNKLLVVRGPTKWSLPKGHREFGEKIYETATREIFEETSIRVQLGEKSKFQRILKCIYYFIQIDDGVKLNLRWIDAMEVCDIRWCTHEDLTMIPCNKQLKYIINKWTQMNEKFYKYGNIIKYHITLPTDKEIDTIIQKFCMHTYL